MNRGKGTFFSYLITLALGLGLSSANLRAEPQPAASETPEGEWQQWVNRLEESEKSNVPIVTHRAIVHNHRFELLGLSAGISERRDLYDLFHLSSGLRYFFSENHGWEILRATYYFSSPNAAAKQVSDSTGYKLDSSPAQWSLASTYLWKPIYGKYGWGDASVVHFDGFLSAGGGIRGGGEGTNQSLQPFGTLGVGMSHFIGENFALVPEIKSFFYSEKRSQSTFVTELSLSLGATWLF